MSRFVQALENRTLFSANALTLAEDLGSIHSAAATFGADAAHTRQTVVADRTAIFAAVRAGSTKANRASNNKLIATLLANDVRLNVQVVITAAQLVTFGDLRSIIAFANGKALLAHPTSTTLQSSLSNNINALQTLVATRVVNFDAALSSKTTVLETDLDNLVAANPAVATLVSTDDSTIKGEVSQFRQQANVYQATTSALATDLGTIG